MRASQILISGESSRKETRFLLMMLRAFCLRTGILWFAWTSSPAQHLNPWPQILAGVPIGLGIQLINTQGLTNPRPNAAYRFAVGDVTLWKGIKQAGNAVIMGRFVASSLAAAAKRAGNGIARLVGARRSLHVLLIRADYGALYWG
jgi:hypothetical protein